MLQRFARSMRVPRYPLGVALILVAGGCAAPIRQFDLRNQPLSCDEANKQAFRTLEAMGFAIAAFEPATAERVGVLRGSREQGGSSQDVTVEITCESDGATIIASEDRRWLNQLEFKRGFYLSFTSIRSATAARAAAAREEAARPLEEKLEKGLRVQLQPLRGQAAKLDFNLDLAAAGVLPVRVQVNNVTRRAYRLDADDVVLIRRDGRRIEPLRLEEVVERVVAAERHQSEDDPVHLERSALVQKLNSVAFEGGSLASGESVGGYLYYPSAEYTKGRVVLEDQASEETEGFVVEF